MSVWKRKLLALFMNPATTTEGVQEAASMPVPCDRSTLPLALVNAFDLRRKEALLLLLPDTPVLRMLRLRA